MTRRHKHTHTHTHDSWLPRPSRARIKGRHGETVVFRHAEVLVDGELFVTGRKKDQKVYYHHTGFIGGIKERSAKFILESRFPERIVEKAVQRMLPRGPLGRAQFGNLRVYKGSEHPHAAQQPEAVDVAVLTRKNARA